MYQNVPIGAMKARSARYRAVAAWFGDCTMRDLRARFKLEPRFPVVRGGVERGGTGIRQRPPIRRHDDGGPDHAA